MLGASRMELQMITRQDNPSMSAQADVIVIGGGANGALITFELAKRGYQVITLEKGALGNGSSSRSAACIRAQFGDPRNVLGMVYAEWFFENFYSILGVPEEEQNEWLFEQNGYLFLYEDPGQIEDSAKSKASAKAWLEALKAAHMQQKLGLPVEILDPSTVHARYPHINPELLIGATFCPTDGFLNHDLIYLRGFEMAQRHYGAQVFTNTEVIGATRAKDGTITTLHTTSGDFSAKWIVNATNAWAPRLSKLLGGMELPITPFKRYLYWVQPHSSVFSDDSWKKLPFTIFGMGPDRGSYCRPHHNELMYGWAHEAEPEPQFSDEDQDRIGAGFHPDSASGDRDYWLEFRLNVNDFSELLANTGRARATAGYYGQTPDHQPIIDVDTQVSNLIHAVGFSGHGLMMSPVTAQVVAALVDGRGEIVNRQICLPPMFRPEMTKLMLDCSHFSATRDFYAQKEGAYI
ncbi:MAG: FAD-binding oxidoreductase [Patescibacteria group bacterium]